MPAKPTLAAKLDEASKSAANKGLDDVATKLAAQAAREAIKDMGRALGVDQ